MKTRVVLVAVALASCASPPPGLPHVSIAELCGDRSLAGRQFWLDGPFDDTSLIPLHPFGASTCAPGECCVVTRYSFGFVCDDRAIVLAPGDLVGTFTNVVERDLQQTALVCEGSSDGTLLGGSGCVPTDCALRPAPNITHVASVRGVLATVPTTLTGRADPVGPFLPPVHAFGVAEVRLVAPSDASSP